MRRVVVAVAAMLLSLIFTSSAWAEVDPKIYSKSDYGLKWTDEVNGVIYDYPGFDTSVHPQGTWNDPSTIGVDAYSYNDPQDYTEPHTRVIYDSNGKELITIAAGPHGNYLTTTHKCRECHAVHRSSGTFMLTRSDTRFEACEWCHGLGAGSGFNIQTDNDADYTAEYDVGHTIGYGISSGKWSAPDDTYPAYSPPYWMGGFSCFDCHSPHANPQRLLGFANGGEQTYPIYNPGYDNLTSSLSPGKEAKYPAGSWLLLKNPDRELHPSSGSEILDTDLTTHLTITWSGGSFSSAVNKQAIDWEKPVGLSDGSAGGMRDGFHISEFCADCHDANAGLSSQKVAVYSEDRALRGQTETDSYDMGTGHDSNQRQTGMHYLFDPKDGKNDGPACRNCHKGSSDCKICHSDAAELSGSVKWPREAFTRAVETAVEPPPVGWGGPGYKTILNVNDPHYTPAFKHERNVVYPSDWRVSSDISNCSSACSNDGFSWPHKTLSWKMLKDNLFGVDFDGVTVVRPGEERTIPSGASGEFAEKIRRSGVLGPAHDLDSVCLDCHNPGIWNPQYKNELILKGLP